VQHRFPGEAAVEEIARDGRDLLPRGLDRDLRLQLPFGDQPDQAREDDAGGVPTDLVEKDQAVEARAAAEEEGA